MFSWQLYEPGSLEITNFTTAKNGTRNGSIPWQVINDRIAINYECRAGSREKNAAGLLAPVLEIFAANLPTFLPSPQQKSGKSLINRQLKQYLIPKGDKQNIPLTLVLTKPHFSFLQLRMYRIELADPRQVKNDKIPTNSSKSFMFSELGLSYCWGCRCYNYSPNNCFTSLMFLVFFPGILLVIFYSIRMTTTLLYVSPSPCAWQLLHFLFDINITRTINHAPGFKSPARVGGIEKTSSPSPSCYLSYYSRVM